MSGPNEILVSLISWDYYSTNKERVGLLDEYDSSQCSTLFNSSAGDMNFNFSVYSFFCQSALDSSKLLLFEKEKICMNFHCC